MNASAALAAPGVVTVALPDSSATVKSTRLSTTNVVLAPAPAPGVVLPVGELSISGLRLAADAVVDRGAVLNRRAGGRQLRRWRRSTSQGRDSDERRAQAGSSEGNHFTAPCY